MTERRYTSQDDTSSPKYRAECEARYVLAMVKQRRNEFYAAVAKVRGEAAVKALIAEVNRQADLKRKG